MPIEPSTTPAPAGPPEAGEPGTLQRKYVRVLERASTPGGLVAFEFSIGWPDLSVELVLPRPAFDAFCAMHRVELLPTSAAPPAPATPPTDSGAR
jgi:phenol hydroxylase P0 protein